MRVCIVWAKGKKVTLKNLLGRKFREYLAKRPYLRDTHEILQAGMTLQLLTCASHVPFSRVIFSRASCELVMKLH